MPQCPHSLSGLGLGLPGVHPTLSTRAHAAAAVPEIYALGRGVAVPLCRRCVAGFISQNKLRESVGPDPFVYMTPGVKMQKGKNWTTQA